MVFKEIVAKPKNSKVILEALKLLKQSFDNDEFTVTFDCKSQLKKKFDLCRGQRRLDFLEHGQCQAKESTLPAEPVAKTLFESR